MSNSDPHGEPPRRPSFDAGPGRSASPRGTSFFIHIALLVIGAVICLRVFWGIYSTSLSPVVPPQDQATTKVGVATNPPAQNADAATSAATAALQVTAAEAASTLSAAKSQQREFLNHSELLTGLLDQWQASLDKWNQDFASLATQDAGSPLAATPESVKRFRAVYLQERPSQVRLDQVRELLEQLSRDVTDAWPTPDSLYLPSASAFTQIQSLGEEAKAAIAAYRSAIAQVVALERQAKQQGLTSDQSLREALAAQEQVEQLAAVDKARERFDKAQHDADERVAVAKEEAIRVAGEVEARKIMDAANAARTRQTEEEELHKQEQAKNARLNKMQREMSDIQKHLRPFITKGYAQPGNTDNIQTGDSLPMSLSKLTALGALQDGREGMEKLMRCATVNNDRDHGSFPQYLGGERGWQQTNKEFLKRAHQLLTEYGDLLVEKGLLSP